MSTSRPQYDLSATLDIARGADYQEHGIGAFAGSSSVSATDVSNIMLSLKGGAKQPVAYIGDAPIGPIADSIYRIPIDQMVPDDPHLLLRPNYKPEDDPDLPGLMTSIRKTGGLLEPLSILWRGETQTTNDLKERPLFRIRLGIRRWYALRGLANGGEDIAASAPVIFLQDQTTEAQQLLAALTQQKNSKPLTLLEYADSVRRLVAEFGYTTQAVAEFLGEQQDRISRLNLAAQCSERIRAFMHQDSLTLKHVDRLRNCEDIDLRDLVATYVVQEGFSAEKTQKIIALLCPLPGQDAKLALSQGPDQRLRLVPLAGASESDLDDVAPEQHYWQRQSPLFVPVARIMSAARQHQLSLRGGPKQPIVQVQQLMITQTLQKLVSEPSAEIDAVALALALQADLEALNIAYSQLQREAAARKGKRGLSVVSSDVVRTPVAVEV